MMTISLLADEISRHHSRLGPDKPLDEAIEALVGDVAACLMNELRANRLETASALFYGQPMKPAEFRHAMPPELGYVTLLWLTHPPKPSFLKPREAVTLAGELRALVQATRTRGIASRTHDLWRLIWLPTIPGLKMPVIATILVDRSSNKRDACDTKHLFRERRAALKAMAGKIAPLMALAA
jgi:hypothetical protein